MKLTKEIKTAVLVIGAILLFIWGYGFLKGENILNSHLQLFVQYNNVEGLATGAPVTISGKTVGKVKKISLNKNGSVLVEIQIDDDQFPIQQSSIAQIYQSGPISGMQIAINPNYKDTRLVNSGDTLNADVKLGMLDALGSKFEPTQAKVNALLDNSNKLVAGVNNVLSQKGQQDLQNSLSELSTTMTEFRKISTSINLMLDQNSSNIGNISTNFSKVSGDFVVISDSLKKANLGTVVKNLEKTLAKVDAIMLNLQAGKGTMGKMLTDDAMYKNLTKTSKELELLLQDVRLSPTRYVNVSLFGKKNKPYVAPKDSIKITN